MAYRIFISSVQREFAKERKALAEMYKRHKSYPANPLLAYAMFLRKYVEQTGMGTSPAVLTETVWALAHQHDIIAAKGKAWSGVFS